MPPRKIQKRLVSTYVVRKPSGKYAVRVVRKKGETRSTKESLETAVRNAKARAKD